MCDVNHVLKGKPYNATVALSVDVDRFWELMLDALIVSNQLSPLNSGQ